MINKLIETHKVGWAAAETCTIPAHTGAAKIKVCYERIIKVTEQINTYQSMNYN